MTFDLSTDAVLRGRFSVGDFEYEFTELKNLKNKFSRDWPWSHSENALDLEMIERSKIAHERGDGESIDDLIVKLG
jgi:hypothetical protein